MIASVRGEVLHKGLSTAVVDVMGLGLELQATPQTLSGLHEGREEGEPGQWHAWMDAKPVVPDTFPRMSGAEVSLDWILRDETALSEPVVIEQPDGLGMQMPAGEFTVDSVVAALGGETPVAVIGARAGATDKRADAV